MGAVDALFKVDGCAVFIYIDGRSFQFYLLVILVCHCNISDVRDLGEGPAVQSDKSRAVKALLFYCCRDTKREVSLHAARRIGCGRHSLSIDHDRPVIGHIHTVLHYFYALTRGEMRIEGVPECDCLRAVRWVDHREVFCDSEQNLIMCLHIFFIDSLDRVRRVRILSEHGVRDEAAAGLA